MHLFLGMGRRPQRLSVRVRNAQQLPSRRDQLHYADGSVRFVKNSIAAWPINTLYVSANSEIITDQYGNPLLNPASPYGMPPWQAMWSMNGGEIISSDSY